MKFPAWLKVRRQEKVHDHLELTLELDLDAYQRAVLSSASYLPSDLRALALVAPLSRVAAVRRMVATMEVRQAGVEARMYVRGAMDPAYASPEARDAYVKTLYPEQAAAFLRGWVEHHPEPVCSCQVTPERFHFVYYGATEPGSMWEWNPDCPVHRPDPNPVPVPVNYWSPVAATISCDWCGECAWCLTYPAGP